jgi:hypothetical protein
MHRTRLAWIGFCLAIPLSLHAQDAPPASAQTERPRATPLTVCELLEDVDQNTGKIVAVVGRLSSELFDGAWLSEDGCNAKVPPSDPHWPYAVFLGCFDDTRPDPAEGKPDIDSEALKAKLERLRKTTQLEYYTPLVTPRPGQPPQKPRPTKETWAVAFGRIKPAPTGQKGWFGGVRARAQLCSSSESRLIRIEEPDGPQTVK